MSALVAVIHRGQRPASRDDVAAALPLLAPRGPDGTTVWAEGRAAFAHLALHSTPESAHERWPMAMPGGGWLLADARIDNRAELLGELAPPATSAPLTDAALIGLAHQHWGPRAPAHLVGDYAYLVWEPLHRRVRLVRSALALKPLYFRLLPDRLVVASSLRAVSALTPMAALNERWLAAFLMHTWRPAEDTALSEIKQVVPGTTLTIDLEQGRQQGSTFWVPRISDECAGWNEDTWCEAVTQHFEAAVSAAFRTASPVASSLSGGIDSSAINLVAHRLMHDAHRMPSQEVHTYSLRMPDYPDTDESEYREAAAARLPRFHTHWIDVDAAWCWQDVEAWHAQMSTPSLFPNAWMFKPFYQAARERGARIKVSGAGGDLITGSEDYALVEAWRSFPLWERLDELRYFRPRHVLGIWLHSEAPALIRTPWVRLRRGEQHPLHTPTMEALRYPAPPPVAQGTPRQNAIIEQLTQAHHLQPFQQRAEIAAMHGLELRMPYYDRRLVELMLQMPMRLRIRRRKNRVLFKRAFRNDLPDLLFTRTRKADFTRFAMESVKSDDRQCGLHLSAEMWLVRQGWIEPEAWHWRVMAGRWVELFLHAHVNQWVEMRNAEGGRRANVPQKARLAQPLDASPR